GSKDEKDTKDRRDINSKTRNPEPATRNPQPHLRSDTPDTLDYGFLRKSTQLLFAHCLGYASSYSSLS
ncbi:MAG TPA: hypothetical protein PKZ53_25865, partial [Acidobacteriota bacterium]|nr:hypothetical protein [Acidobacteriota bacterium]